MDSEHYPCHEETLLLSDVPPTEEELKLMATLDDKYICDKRVGEACVKVSKFIRYIIGVLLPHFPMKLEGRA